MLQPYETPCQSVGNSVKSNLALAKMQHSGAALTRKCCPLRSIIPLQVLGAGKTDGAMDAANLLKPMLARGELRCIGATTLAEYRQHMEKDAAFERRFQQVCVKAKSQLAHDNTLLCPAEAKRLCLTLLEIHKHCPYPSAACRPLLKR